MDDEPADMGLYKTGAPGVAIYDQFADIAKGLEKEGTHEQAIGVLVDFRRCIGCFACAMACKNQYHQPPGVVWRRSIP